MGIFVILFTSSGPLFWTFDGTKNTVGLPKPVYPFRPDDHQTKWNLDLVFCTSRSDEK
jgi:hypothetical protein